MIVGKKRRGAVVVWSTASDLQQVWCGGAVCDLCDRIHESVRYGTGDVWRERGAEEVESAEVVSPTAATAATTAAAAAATCLATLTLPLSSLTHTLCCSCVCLWKEELQSGVHLGGDNRGQMSGLRVKRGEVRRDRVVSTHHEGANSAFQCSAVSVRENEREVADIIIYAR
jgi:hypothetical protein